MNMEMEWSYRYYAQQQSKLADAPIAPMKTIVELETRSFPFPLPERMTKIYDGNFYLPPSSSARPYGVVVFASTLNGKVTFAEPKDIGAGPTDYYFYHELSKVFADAVVAGAETLRGKTGQERITLTYYDLELIKFRARVLKKSRHPLQVVITGSGNLEAEKEFIFNLPEFQVIVFTTERGEAALRSQRFTNKNVRILGLGDKVDFRKVSRILYEEYGVRCMVVIGGATVATEFIDVGLIDELFLTSANTLGGKDTKTFYEGEKTFRLRTISLKLLPSMPAEGNSVGPVLRRVRFG